MKAVTDVLLCDCPTWYFDQGHKPETHVPEKQNTCSNLSFKHFNPL